MRTIKFRAWDTERKDIFDVVAINYKKKRVYSSWNEPNGSNLYAEFDRVVLMQYTGLKDKNGTEIYEGDILHKDRFWPRFIEFEEGSFVSAPLNKVQYHNRKFYPIGCSDYQDWEVIGNIYENPEMLEA